VTEVLGLVLVAWLVYVSDAVWWIKPDRIVLYGPAGCKLGAQLGPRFVLRGSSGLFIPGLFPAFHMHFEVDATSGAAQRTKERDIVAVAEQACAAARRLHQLATILWVHCFVLAPALLVTFGLRRVWIFIIVGLFGGAVVIVGFFARAWRFLYPSDSPGWKREVLPMVLSPFAAICAADTLTRPLFLSFNGLAVVRALATRQDFLRIVRFYYFRDDPNPAVHGLLARDVEDAVRTPPARAGMEMEGYCPRCHTQLTRLTGTCPECLDIEIVPFDAITPSGGPSDRFQSAARH
jgi:hypothetical protein